MELVCAPASPIQDKFSQVFESVRIFITYFENLDKVRYLFSIRVLTDLDKNPNIFDDKRESNDC